MPPLRGIKSKFTKQLSSFLFNLSIFFFLDGLITHSTVARYKRKVARYKRKVARFSFIVENVKISNATRMN